MIFGGICNCAPVFQFNDFFYCFPGPILIWYLILGRNEPFLQFVDSLVASIVCVVGVKIKRDLRVIQSRSQGVPGVRRTP